MITFNVFPKYAQISTHFTLSHVFLCNVYLACVLWAPSLHHMLFCISCTTRHTVDASQYFILSERNKAEQSIQVKSWNNFFFSLNIQITLPSEHFIISDVTQNKLYSFPGIRISRLLTPGMCANESVSFVLWAGPLVPHGAHLHPVCPVAWCLSWVLFHLLNWNPCHTSSQNGKLPLVMGYFS